MNLFSHAIWIEQFGHLARIQHYMPELFDIKPRCPSASVSRGCEIEYCDVADAP